MPEGCEFLAISNKLGAFARINAVDAKYLVVGPGNEVVAGLLVGIVTVPDSNPFQPHHNGFVVFQSSHIEAATVAIDAATEAGFLTSVLCNNMSATAAGIEIAGAMAVLDAEPE